MKPTVEGLIDNLQRQLDTYRHINALEKEKQQALVDKDTQTIDKIVVQEEQVIHSLRQLEAERVAWAASFVSNQNSSSGENLSLGKLADDYPDLHDLGDKLRAELEELNQTNHLNRQLIDSQLAYINFMLQTVVGDTKPMYGSPGTLVQNTNSRYGGSSLSLIDRDA